MPTAAKPQSSGAAAPLPALSDSEAASILVAGQSPRYSRIDSYQRYFDGSVYEGRADFLDVASDTPLLERAPCVIDPIVRAALQSHVSLCLGEGRFPTFSTLTNESDAGYTTRFALPPSQSTVLDAGIQRITEQAGLKTVFQALLESALSSGDAVPIVSLERGRFKVTQLDPKVCTPAFCDARPWELESLTVSYRYVDDVWDITQKKWLRVVKQYRRVIDKVNDIVFEPVIVRTVDDFPIPDRPRAGAAWAHNFGFVPVVWHKRRASTSAMGDVDGRPLHWGLASELDALHFALSQRHRAALYCGDPQVWETGVDDGGVKAPMGRTAAGVQPTSINPAGAKMNNGWAFGTGGGGRGGSVRKKGPGAVWTYESDTSKVGLLTLPGDALTSIDKHITDLRSTLQKALSYVFVDPTTVKGTGDISGKSLAFIFGSQTSFCDQEREDFARGCMLPVFNLILRILQKTQGVGIYLPGVEKIVPILSKFVQSVDGADAWFEPRIELRWGDYFTPSDADEATRVTMAASALEAGLVTQKSAVQHIAGVFMIANVDDYVDALAKEKAQRQADALANAQATAALMPKPAPASPAAPTAAPTAPAKASAAPGTK